MVPPKAAAVRQKSSSYSSKRQAAQSVSRRRCRRRLRRRRDSRTFLQISALKAMFSSEHSLGAFYHAIELYNRKQINSGELINLLTPFFVHSPSLMRTLHELFNEPPSPTHLDTSTTTTTTAAIVGGSGGERLLPLEMRVAEAKALEIDYTTAMVCLAPRRAE